MVKKPMKRRWLSNQKKQLKFKKKEPQVRYVIVKIQLSIKLNNYINIFNKESAGKLLFNHPKDHAININNKNLYIDLYIFFLIKNWRCFTNI